jgi:tetratricopeptide (TPR) repeat protein/tRNA A-37 threonylcarbamoyl transferase component Bud32
VRTAESVDSELEGLLSDQVRDWMGGQRPPIQVYLDRRPRIRGQPGLVLELINQEVVLRQMRGETPRPEDYLAEFPEISDSLLRLFEVHALASFPTGLRAGPVEGSTLPEPGAPRDGAERMPRIPGYEIESILGRGGMGVVYLARQHALNRKVALKLLREGHQDDRALRDRFEREAAAVARCQHPNLVQIYEIGQHDGQSYLALEYIEGGTLARGLAGTPQPPRVAAALVETLARAIEHAHRQGVVHRDLKPANVLLTTDGQPKITDFGLAKLADTSTRTEVGTVLGTLAYMAPEQVQGAPAEIGARADIHALGAILYEALTGRPPYRAETPEKMFRTILFDPVVPPSERQRWIPRDLESICLKCLEKGPVERYSSAEALAEDLRRFLDGRTILARRASTGERVARWCRRNPWAAATFVILVAAVTSTSVLAVAAWRAARTAERAEAATRKERDRAESEAEVAKAVTDFFNQEVLAQANPNTQATPDSKLDPDLKVRDALDRAAQRVAAKFGGKPRVEAAIRHTIGEAYFRLGLHEKARQHLERALQLFRGTLGDEDLETLKSMPILAELYIALDERKLAEDTLISMRDGFRQLEGAEHPDTLVAINALGQLYFSAGRLGEAEKLFDSALTGLRGAVGNRDIRTIEAMNNLGMAYQEQRRLDEAEPLLKEALEGVKDVNGPEHPDTLTVMQNLGEFYYHHGKLAAAEELFDQVLKIRTRVLGPNHLSTIVSKHDLAMLYQRQTRLAEAEELLREVVATRSTELGPKHHQTLMAISNLAACSAAEGKLADAARLMKQAFQGYSDTHGESDPGTVFVMSNLGKLYHWQGNLAEAQRLLEKAVAGLSQTPGVAHPDTLTAMSNLAQLYVTKGEAEKAEPLLEEVLKLRRKVLSQDHPDTLDAMDALGGCRCNSLKDYAQAEAVLRECLAIREDKSPEDWQRFNTQSLLGGCLVGQKRHAEAERLLLPAYEGMKAREKKIPPAEKLRLDEALGRLIQLYDAWGKKDKAEEWRSRLADLEFPDEPFARPWAPSDGVLLDRVVGMVAAQVAPIR